MMQPAVRFTATARDDLIRLFGHLVSSAESAEDLAHAAHVIERLEEHVVERLSAAPFVYRKAGASPFVRELIVPVGSSGYVVLYEIEGAGLITVLAVRHQREEDFH